MDVILSREAFGFLTKSINELLRTFDGFYDKVLAEHNGKAIELTNICYELHLEFYKHMQKISSISNDSSKSMADILVELRVAEKCRKFDADTSTEIKTNVNKLSEILTSYKDQTKHMQSKIAGANRNVKTEQERLISNRPNFDFIKQCGLIKTSERLEKSSNTVAVIGRFFLHTVANAVNGIFRLVNQGKTNKFDDLSEVLDKLSERLTELSEASIDFYSSFDETLKLLQNYNISAEKLFKYSSRPSSETTTTRLLLMAEDMIPDTKELQEKFESIKEDAVSRERDIRLALNRIDPFREIEY